MDNRVTLNGAAFYIDWDDIQTNFVRADGHTFTVNAGAARSKGLELELRTLAAQNLELFATASFVDAELSEDQLPPGDGQSGDRIPAVPKTSFAAGLDYSRSLAANLQGFFNLNYRYVGSSFNGFASSTGVSAAIADQTTLLSTRQRALRHRASTLPAYAVRQQPVRQNCGALFQSLSRRRKG